MINKVMSVALAVFNAAFMTSVNGEVMAQNIIPEVSAKSAIVMNASTGEILFEKNPYEKRQMASTTKIMTTLLTIESGSLDEYFVVNSDAIKVEGSTMGLKEGDIVTKRILCYGMLLPSGNDAANAAAVSVAGSLKAFECLMNNRAREIGMKNTYFVTPSGLDDYTDKHYSTAYDMALLTREALKNETFAQMCATKKIKVEFGNPPHPRWLLNTNKLLSMYEGCIGVKTGFTDKAKRCLVSAVEKNGTKLICVTLSAADDWNDHIKMYDYAFSRMTTVNMQQQDISLDIVGGIKDKVAVKPAEEPSLKIRDTNASDVKQCIILDRFLYAPVKKGQAVGCVRFIMDDKILKEVPLLADENIEYEYNEEEQSFFEKIKNRLF